MDGDNNSSQPVLALPPRRIPRGAWCKYQKQRCDIECTYAPLFPASKFPDFENALKLFGFSNILKTFTMVPPEQKHIAAKTSLIEGKARKNEPVHGSMGVIRDLMEQIASLEKQLKAMNQLITIFKDPEQLEWKYLGELPAPLYGYMETFELNIEAYMDEPIFDMDLVKAFEKHRSPPPHFHNLQVGESSGAAPRAQNLLECLEKQNTEYEAEGASTAQKRECTSERKMDHLIKLSLLQSVQIYHISSIIA